MPLLNLPNELLVCIFKALPDAETCVQLRRACKHTDSIYRANKEIDDQIRDNETLGLASIINDYYDFLTTLYIKESDVKRAPPGGWPGLRKADLAVWQKSRLVLDILSHMNYLDGWQYGMRRNPNLIDVNSVAIDYSDGRCFHTWGDQLHLPCIFKAEACDDRGNFVCGPRYQARLQHVVLIAEGDQDSGVTLYLDTKTCMIHRIFPGMQTEAMNARDYFEEQKDMLRRCMKLPIGKGLDGWWEMYEEVVEAYSPAIEDEGEPVLSDELGHIKDERWLVHLFKKHGWPEKDWRKDECHQAVELYCQSRQRQCGYESEESSDQSSQEY